jgi:alginate O-acetyltransferase complex protein AlgI
MVFSSVVFLFLFLPIVLVSYLPVRNRAVLRNALLLASSLLFYFWGEGAYTLVMLFYIGVNYGCALAIQRFRRAEAEGQQGGGARRVLALAVTLDLLFLFFFKYANFAAANAAPLFAWLGHPLQFGQIHLPIGISFFAFQSISYVVDVYRGDVAASRNLLDFAMYKSFFPQLIAGPIVRYRDVARQVRERVVTVEGLRGGLERFVAGLGKKVIVANTVAAAADRIFAIPAAELTWSVAALGIVCYTLQIYFDFSGYSDMAIGMGRMFGFTFLENFNYPYVSVSIRDFWRRWHISLSTWFRDYLYIPLGGSRASRRRVQANLLAVFLLCGLWHGAGWTFIAWGAWHGCFLALERTSFSALLDKAWRPLRHVYAMLVVAIGWVFFRSDSLGHALQYTAAAFGFAKGSGIAYPLALYVDRELLLALAVGALFSAPVAPWVKGALQRVALGRGSGRIAGLAASGLEHGAVLAQALLLVYSAMLLASGTHNPFIYFRF